MKTNRVFSIVAILALCLTSAPFQAQAQQPVTQSNTASSPARAGDETELSNLVAQLRPRRRAFALMTNRYVANVSGPVFSIIPAAAGPNLSVVGGGGTVGRLTKWTGFNSSNSFIGDSTIFETKTGFVGIGTTAPTSRLTVAGTIESSGGFKFPDGTVQTTAAASAMVSPVQAQTLCTVGDGEAGCVSPVFNVPPGKRLVIEFASQVPSLQAGQQGAATIFTTLDGVEVAHALPNTAPAFNGVFNSKISQVVRIYADPETTVRIVFQRHISVGTAIFFFSFSGHLIDLP